MFIFDYKCEGENVGRYELFKGLIISSSQALLEFIMEWLNWMTSFFLVLIKCCAFLPLWLFGLELKLNIILKITCV